METSVNEPLAYYNNVFVDTVVLEKVLDVDTQTPVVEAVEAVRTVQ